MASIQAHLEEGTRTTISARQFTWLADEPPDLGGKDEGPTPYELLLGGLAACTALTLRLYASHKGISLASVDVVLEFDRVHADDCRECESEESGIIERIRSRVRLGGSFDAAQRERLEQIVRRCPVHKTLTHGVHILSSVDFDESD